MLYVPCHLMLEEIPDYTCGRPQAYDGFREVGKLAQALEQHQDGLSVYGRFSSKLGRST